MVTSNLMRFYDQCRPVSCWKKFLSNSFVSHFHAAEFNYQKCPKYWNKMGCRIDFHRDLKVLIDDRRERKIDWDNFGDYVYEWVKKLVVLLISSYLRGPPLFIILPPFDNWQTFSFIINVSFAQSRVSLSGKGTRCGFQVVCSRELWHMSQCSRPIPELSPQVGD
jgi:hypothetical protein